MTDLKTIARAAAYEALPSHQTPMHVTDDRDRVADAVTVATLKEVYARLQRSGYHPAELCMADLESWLASLDGGATTPKVTFVVRCNDCGHLPCDCTERMTEEDQSRSDQPQPAVAPLTHAAITEADRGWNERDEIGRQNMFADRAGSEPRPNSPRLCGVCDQPEETHGLAVGHYFQPAPLNTPAKPDTTTTNDSQWERPIVVPPTIHCYAHASGICAALQQLNKP